MTQTITIEQIKELRDQTGVGMAKCKEALVVSDGNLEQAIVHLRKSGMLSAAKKEGRETKEGAISVAQTDRVIGMVEINAETDFVVNNEVFQQFITNIADEIAKTTPTSLEEFLQQPYTQDQALTIDEYRATIVQKIGENIQIRRLHTFEKNSGHSVGVYSHMGGKIVTVVELAGANDQEEFAREIAMHTAATKPEYLSPEQVPEEMVNREKEIAKEQIKGKPEHILEKILEGKLRAYYDQVCLVKQKFVRDDKVTIEQLLSNHAKEAGKNLSIVDFTYWKVGE